MGVLRNRTLRSRCLDGTLVLITMITVGLIAEQVMAGGTKCPTALNLSSKQPICSGLSCSNGGSGTCQPHTFNGFPRSVTVYNVVWNGNRATVTPFLTYVSPGPVGCTMDTCACKVVDPEDQSVSWGDDWCCDAVYVDVPGQPRRPGTVGSCQEDGCTNPNPNCTLVVTAVGFIAEAECKP